MVRVDGLSDPMLRSIPGRASGCYVDVELVSSLILLTHNCVFFVAVCAWLFVSGTDLTEYVACVCTGTVVPWSKWFTPSLFWACLRVGVHSFMSFASICELS